MSLPRLCTAALVATFALHAAAQSISASPKAATITMSYPQSITVFPEASTQQFLQPQRQALQPLTTHVTLGSPSITVKNLNPALTAQLNAPCFTMRSYGFTAHDLKSDSPRPSTYTTCTPAATSELKEIQISPATVKILKAVPPTQ